MDPQQELFSEFLVSLKEKYKGTETGVYDTFLPPDGTPYPFVYLADSQQNDQNTKSEVIGRVSHFMCGTTIQGREERYQAFWQR